MYSNNSKFATKDPQDALKFEWRKVWWYLATTACIGLLPAQTPYFPLRISKINILQGGYS